MFELIDINDLKSFIIEHNLISYSVSWVVAVSFTLFIQSAVGDILLPSIYYIFQSIKMALGFSNRIVSVESSLFEKVNKINVANFLKETISLFLILLVLYILIKDIIDNWVQIPIQQQQKNGSGLISSLPTTNTNNNTSITQQPYYFTSNGSTGVSG